MHEMATKIIPKNLKPQARVMHIEQGGKELCNEEEIIVFCQCIMDALSNEYSIQQAEKTSPHDDNSSRGSLQNQDSSGAKRNETTHHAGHMMEHTNGGLTM
jgi:hypothetical protein